MTADKDKENKTEVDCNNETVANPVLNENETDIKPKRIKKKKVKTLPEGVELPSLEEINADNAECQEPSPKKKKKKKTGPKLKKDEGCIANDVEEEYPSVSVEPAKKEEEPAGTGFTILEEFKGNKNNKVFRVLPTWLAKPSVISCDLSKNKMPIKELNGLDKFLHDALNRNKIGFFFPGNFFLLFSVVTLLFNCGYFQSNSKSFPGYWNPSSNFSDLVTCVFRLLQEAVKH